MTRTIDDAELDRFVNSLAARLAFFDKAALAAARVQNNGATLPPDADLLAADAEYANSLTWPSLQARLPQFGKLIAKQGPDDVERRLGYYIGIGNQQPEELQLPSPISSPIHTFLR